MQMPECLVSHYTEDGICPNAAKDHKWPRKPEEKCRPNEPHHKHSTLDAELLHKPDSIWIRLLEAFQQTLDGCYDIYYQTRNKNAIENKVDFKLHIGNMA
jgi:hypothetical protein